jgi:ribosome-associated protein
MNREQSENIRLNEQIDPELKAERPPKRTVQLEQSREMALDIVRVTAENRGQGILLLDLTAQTALFDFFIIATGSSRRQLAAMSTEIDRLMKERFRERKLSISGFEEGRWIILDYGSIVVHLFDEDTRRFYDLESLWGDAKEVDISAIISQASIQIARVTDSADS